MLVSLAMDSVALTTMNVPMVTTTVMLMQLVPTMTVVSHVPVTPAILVKVMTMIALISMNVLLIPTNVTMLLPVPIPSAHMNVNAWPVTKELDVIALTLMNAPLEHTLARVT